MFCENRFGIKKNKISYFTCVVRTPAQFPEPYHSNHMIPHRVNYITSQWCSIGLFNKYLENVPTTIGGYTCVWHGEEEEVVPWLGGLSLCSHL